MRRLLLLGILLGLLLTGCTTDAQDRIQLGTPVPNVPVTISNVAEPYLIAIAEGDLPDHMPVAAFGWNPTVGNTSEDIWLGSSVYTFPASAIQMRMVSTNAQDSAAGTGIRVVTIYYLDGSYNEHTEDVTMNGVTPVNTAATNIFRVNDIKAKTVGSTGAAVGQLSLGNVGGTTFYRYILAGTNRSRGTIYTVPLGKHLHIDDMYVGVSGLNASNFARITLRATYDDQSATLLTAGLFFMPYAEVALPNGSFVRTFDIPLTFPEKTDVKISAYTDAGSAAIEASFRAWTEVPGSQ